MSFLLHYLSRKSFIVNNDELAGLGDVLIRSQVALDHESFVPPSFLLEASFVEEGIPGSFRFQNLLSSLVYLSNSEL